MDEVKRIVGQIRKGVVKPIYFLYGEEPYFIDKLSDYMAKNLLTEEERGFNQTILYGKDISIDDIVASAKRYPMMAERQVIIVKEAQDLSRHIEKLVAYVEQPQPTTVLVICFKYKKLDKRKKLFKAIVKTGEVVESKKLYENKVTDWLRNNLLSDGFTISHKAAMLLVEYLGTDLGLIDNELRKLKLVLPPKTEISPKHIEDNVGISKDFNNFELTKAIGERNVLKASRIITYFAQNPKDNPFVVTVSLLHQFFVRLLKYHGLSDHDPQNVAKALGVNFYFVKEYQTAARNYPMKRVSQIISHLRQMDVKGKGVGSAGLSQADLLKELIVKII